MFTKKTVTLQMRHLRLRNFADNQGRNSKRTWQIR